MNPIFKQRKFWLKVLGLIVSALVAGGVIPEAYIPLVNEAALQSLAGILAALFGGSATLDVGKEVKGKLDKRKLLRDADKLGCLVLTLGLAGVLLGGCALMGDSSSPVLVHSPYDLPRSCLQEDGTLIECPVFEHDVFKGDSPKVVAAKLWHFNQAVRVLNAWLQDNDKMEVALVRDVLTTLDHLLDQEQISGQDFYDQVQELVGRTNRLTKLQALVISDSLRWVAIKQPLPECIRDILRDGITSQLRLLPGED